MEAGEPVNVSVPQNPSEVEVCDHDWEKVREQTVQETQQKNTENANHLAKSPSKAGAMRGYLFENKGIDANMKKMQIQATSAFYQCKKCGAEQEVDIIGVDQIAEAKSRNAKKVKSKKDQARRQLDIQAKLFNKQKKPLAKIDGALPDVAETKEIYLRRGYDVEIVP